MSLPIISGSWSGANYFVSSDDGDVIRYLLSINTQQDHGIKYTRSTSTWEDDGISNPYNFNSWDSFAQNISLFNPWFVHGFRPDGSKVFEFESPHYDSGATGTEGGTNTGAMVSYLADDGTLRTYIPLSEFTTIHNPVNSGGRDLYYRLRGTGSYFNEEILHTYSYNTHSTFTPASAGTYYLERVYTNPLVVHIYDHVEVTQAEFDVWNPPEDDPPSSPAIYVPRLRRGGNLNFW